MYEYTRSFKKSDSRIIPFELVLFDKYIINDKYINQDITLNSFSIALKEYLSISSLSFLIVPCMDRSICSWVL